ncbi:transient receptor potential channel pyrexia-like [Neocloeon triangulifer]|uniref:transient receptor potential channel pyrexia-like n=1 Tax=Neocloeon triangulifer TaxID=2078957 RepID=UPI00286EC917|nr:transient receptor potential channel pyrexia-like [Neocloeon triangulifer]
MAENSNEHNNHHTKINMEQLESDREVVGSYRRRTCSASEAPKRVRRYLSFYTAVNIAKGVANLAESSEEAPKEQPDEDVIKCDCARESCGIEASRHFNQMVKAMTGDNIPQSTNINCEHTKEVFKMTQDPAGFTLLQCATIFRNLQVMKFFLETYKDLIDVNQKATKNLMEVTALHLAAQADFPEGIRLLLKYGALIDKINETGFTALHHAALHKSTEAAKCLIEAGASLKHTAPGFYNFSALSMVLRKTPKAIDSIYKKLDESITVKGGEKPEGDALLSETYEDTSRRTLIFNFSKWQGSPRETVSFSLLHVFAKEHNLEHPLLRAMLEANWERAKNIYYGRILFGMLFLGFITSYVLTKGDPYWQIYALLLFAFLDFVRKAASLYSYANSPTANRLSWTLQQYFLSFDNYCEIVCYFGVLLFWLSDDVILKDHVGPMIFLAGWFKFIVMIGEFPIFGLYIDMYYDVVKSFVKLIFSFSIYLLGFIICFCMYFNGDTHFSAFYTALVKVAAMMVGELEYGDLAKAISEGTLSKNVSSTGAVTEIPGWYRVFPLTCVLIFIVAVPIVLMSLLLGIVVQDVNDIKCNAQSFKLARKAELVEYCMVTTGYVSRFCKLCCCSTKAWLGFKRSCSPKSYAPSEEKNNDKYEIEYALDDDEQPSYLHKAYEIATQKCKKESSEGLN